MRTKRRKGVVNTTDTEEELIMDIHDIKEKIEGNKHHFLDKNDKVDFIKLSQFIIQELNIVVPKNTKDIMRYDTEEGMYVEGQADVGELVNLCLGGKATSRNTNEIYHFIRNMAGKKESELNKDKFVITLQNGNYNIQTQEFLPHSPEVYTTTKLPITYNKEADCPRIKNFLMEIVNPENVPLVQEIIGYCLLRDYPVHKAVMFVGTGSNGKSTLINLIREFLGDENCSSISLQKLGTDQFSLAELFNRMANLCPDLNKTGLKNTGVFKMITGKDRLTADRKFKQPISFVSFAKQIFSANELPRTDDMSYAFFRRWIILNFPNRFEKATDKKTILKEITTDAELSGLFNFAVQGLRNLLERGAIIETISTAETEKEYLRRSSSADAFTKENLEFNSHGLLEKEDLYETYARWCEKHNLVTEDTRNLTIAITKQIYQARLAQSREFKRKLAWTGIGFKKNSEIITVENESEYEKLDVEENYVGFNTEE